MGQTYDITFRGADGGILSVARVGAASLRSVVADAFCALDIPDATEQITIERVTDDP